MRLIDIEQVERIIDRYIDETGADTFTKDRLIDFLLDSEPVDAVRVVRCKDCKYWDNGCCYRLELSRPIDFCSYGVRK